MQAFRLSLRVRFEWQLNKHLTSVLNTSHSSYVYMQPNNQQLDWKGLHVNISIEKKLYDWKERCRSDQQENKISMLWIWLFSYCGWTILQAFYKSFSKSMRPTRRHETGGLPLHLDLAKKLACCYGRVTES